MEALKDAPRSECQVSEIANINKSSKIRISHILPRSLGRKDIWTRINLTRWVVAQGHVHGERGGNRVEARLDAYTASIQGRFIRPKAKRNEIFVKNVASGGGCIKGETTSGEVDSFVASPCDDVPSAT